MSLTRETCYTIGCDGCRHLLGYDDDGVVHFASEQDAIEAATDREWITGDGGRVLCGDCITATGCELLGHQWSPWRTRTTAAGDMQEWRYCDTCGGFGRRGDADGGADHGSDGGSTRSVDSGTTEGDTRC